MKRPAGRSSAPAAERKPSSAAQRKPSSAAKRKPAAATARAQSSCPDKKPGTTRSPSSPKSPKPAKTAAEKTPEELLQPRTRDSLGASPSELGNSEVSSEAEALAPAGMLLAWDSFSSEKKLRILKEHAYRQPPAWLPTPEWLKSSPEEQRQGD